LLGHCGSRFYYRESRRKSAEKLELLKGSTGIHRHTVYGIAEDAVALLREGVSAGRRHIRRLMRKARAVGGQAEAEHQQRGINGHRSTDLCAADDRPAKPVWAAKDIKKEQGKKWGGGKWEREAQWETKAGAVRGGCRTRQGGLCVERERGTRPGSARPTFNTDQGAQFTVMPLTKLLRIIGIISDGRTGALPRTNLVERLWWTVKNEGVYLRPAAYTASNEEQWPSSSTG